MRTVLVPFLSDFIPPILENRKRMTCRPMKFQPAAFIESNGVLIFGEDEAAYKVWLQDYPCPYGEPGDSILCCVEGNPQPFHQAKVLERAVRRLLDLSDDHIALEGCASREEFLTLWDSIYGDTQDAAHFNPWVWTVRWL